MYGGTPAIVDLRHLPSRILFPVMNQKVFGNDGIRVRCRLEARMGGEIGRNRRWKLSKPAWKKHGTPENARRRRHVTFSAFVHFHDHFDASNNARLFKSGSGPRSCTPRRVSVQGWLRLVSKAQDLGPVQLTVQLQEGNI